MTSSRKRQQTHFEFANPSPKKYAEQRGRGKYAYSSSEGEIDSDPGRIQFEQKACDPSDSGLTYSSPPRAEKDCDSSRIQTLRSSSVGSSASSFSSENQRACTKHSAHFGKSKRGAVLSGDSEGDTPRPKKKSRLVKGRRPEFQPLDAGYEEEEEEDLIKEVDEDMILESRLRNRSKKSAFAHNLERLQRRRRGQVSVCGSEEGEYTDDSESSSVAVAPPTKLEHFEGARPPIVLNDEDPDEGVSEDGADSNFIVEDGDAEEKPELPMMFNMGTFQDLSHHFKVICQLFVHLAVKEPYKRRSFMKEAVKKDYFSVPLAVTRRKLSGMKDSLVTSSIWKPEFMKRLERYPMFRLEHLDFAVPMCDACHLGNRVATLRGVLSGVEYNSLTYKAIGKTRAEEHHAADWNLGRFCAARAQVFHAFTHWEHILYHTLCLEVDRLKEVGTQTNGKERKMDTLGIKDPSPPEYINDADSVMDWLDRRGVISTRWAKMREMMERAHKLEARGKGADEIELV